MKLEIGAAIAEAVDTCIGPYIRAVGAEFAKLDIVDVGRIPRLEDADELVLTVFRNAVNSASDISTEAIANSRCWILPSPLTWPAIGT